MRFSMVVVATLLVSVSCSSGSGSPNPDGGGGGGRTLSADVDGTAFSATLLATATVVGGEVGIIGSDSSGKEIAIAVVTTTVGTFPIPGSTGASIEYTDQGATWESSESTGGTGTLTITSFTSTEIAGTFSGMLAPQGSTTGTATLTNGLFDLLY
jgi:Family of unknown function (DUF6252)